MYQSNTKNYIDHVPLTEEDSLGLLNKGMYMAYVRRCDIKTSKSGKDYFVFTLDVYEKNGKPTTIIDWMALPYKLRHFYESCDMKEKYNDNKLYIEDCINKEVMVNIGLSKPTKEYPNIKNIILDYCKKDDQDVKFDDDKEFDF